MLSERSPPRYGRPVTPTVRAARLDPPGLAADATACAAIYAPYVTGTATSFEEQPPTAEEMARRIAAHAARHAWLVAEVDGAVVGYAYGSPYRPRPAYRWTAETSVYLAVDAPRRTGAGRALYVALLDRLADRGYRRAVAGIALPNDASLGLHRALGFEVVGTERRVGWKLGAWHDLARLQRDLAPDGEDAGVAPPEPR